MSISKFQRLPGRFTIKVAQGPNFFIIEDYAILRELSRQTNFNIKTIHLHLISASLKVPRFAQIRCCNIERICVPRIGRTMSQISTIVLGLSLPAIQRGRNFSHTLRSLGQHHPGVQARFWRSYFMALRCPHICPSSLEKQIFYNILIPNLAFPRYLSMHSTDRSQSGGKAPGPPNFPLKF